MVQLGHPPGLNTARYQIAGCGIQTAALVLVVIQPHQ
jgi:hypothetical protein